jgi:hypothetical protein
VNWLPSQHDARRDGQSRSHGGRVTHRMAEAMRGIMPLFAAASDCAAKPVGLEGLSRGSPG